MHTTEQAKTLWCPMVRAPMAVGDTDESPLAAVNTSSRGERGFHSANQCLSDRCAMWRWDKSPDGGIANAADRFAVTEPPRPAHVPPFWTFHPADDEVACWLEPEAERVARRKGFCGLAGTPGAR